MIFLNHIKNQSYEKRRVFARNTAIGFGVILLAVWAVITFGFSRNVMNYPDLKTPFNAISASVGEVVDSVSSGLSTK